MVKFIAKFLVKIYFLILTYRSIECRELKVVFWSEPTQLSINDDISNGIIDIGKLNLGVNIKDSSVIIDTENYEYNNATFDTFCEILRTEGVTVVIDFTYRRWHLGSKVLGIHQIPFIRVDRMISPFMQMIGEYIELKDGSDVAFIFQNEEDKNEALYHIIEGYLFRTLLFNAIEEKNFVERLRDLRPTPTYYVIFANTNNMNIIFKKISEGKLFPRPHEWHFVFLDGSDKFRYENQIENATKFKVDTKAICESLGMPNLCSGVFTFRRAIISDIFRSLANFENFGPNGLSTIKADCNETIPEENPNELNLDNDFANKLKLSDFVTFLDYISPEEEFEDESVLTYSLNVSITTLLNNETVDLAVWTSDGLRILNKTISPAKRFLRIGTTEAIPWIYYRRDKQTKELILDDEGKPIWEGYCVDFVNALAEKLNIDYEFIVPKKGTFGRRDPDTGRWDGMIGDLVSGETDVAVGALKMYSEREEVVDFIAPYFDTTGITIVMRKPTRETSLFKFMTVLRVEVWLSIIGALSSTSVMIWLLDKYSPYSSQNNPEAYPYPCRKFTLRESFWFALTSFTPQGGGEAPKPVSSRVLVAAYWLFVVLMLATFTANLAAFLTVERMQAPVQSLEQLARQSRINYTVVEGSDTHQYFMNMKFAEDTLYRMWKELVLNASPNFDKFRVWDYPIKEQYGHIMLAINASIPVKDVAAGFQKVNERENADFAFLHDSSEVQYEVTQNCNLTEVGEVFGEQPYAVAVQQGSQLADPLSFALLELQKDRYFEELRAKYWNQTLLKRCSASEETEGITLESLGGVFIATLVGLGVAMLTLAVEVIFYKRKESKKRKKVRKITKVAPFDGNIDPQQNAAPAIAWQTDQPKLNPDITPPPSFETATYFRGRKVPSTITLGGKNFNPNRVNRLGFDESSQKSSSNRFNERKSENDNSFPPYME